MLEIAEGYISDDPATADPKHFRITALLLPVRTHFTQMQAIRLQKKHPEISQDEMFDLINRFK